jgi:hypothetical protein
LVLASALCSNGFRRPAKGLSAVHFRRRHRHRCVCPADVGIASAGFDWRAMWLGGLLSAAGFLAAAAPIPGVPA